MANYNIDAIYNGNTSLPGTERVRIDSSGNIGIGTATPSTKLHIYENANRVTYISQNDNHTARFEAYGTATAIDTTASNGIFFRINSGDIVKFAADGNVGIGTSTATAPLHIYRASNPWIRLNGGGSFGYIRLDDGTSNGYLFKNTSSDTSNGALAGAMYTYTDSGKAFQHIHSGTPLFTILSGGNVGIGTTSVNSGLEVVNSMRMRGILRPANAPTGSFFNEAFALANDGGAAQGYIYSSIPQAGATFPFADYGELLIQGNPRNGYNNGISIITGVGTSQTIKFRVQGDGNVGIGTTSPSSPLAVQSNANQLRLQTQNAPTTIFAVIGARYDTSHPFTIEVANNNSTSSEFMGVYADGGGIDNRVVFPTGNVGIGTTSPAYKLDVNGTGRFSGDLTVSALVGTANSATLYANNGSYGSWKIGGTRNGWYGIEFDSGVSLMVNSTEVGFHRNGIGWQMRWSVGTGYIHKGSNGGGTEATILDSSNYTSYAPGLGTNNTLTGINVINNTSNTLINNQSGNLGLTMQQATAGTDAYMTFHIIGDYAAYFGLGGAENDLVYGGWSAGNNRHRILHSGNAPYAWNMNQYVRTTDTPAFARLTIDGGNYVNNYFQSLSDFVSGTLVTTDIPASATNGLSFVMNVIGKSYNTTTSPFNFSVQGYLYNNQIINYSGLSLDSTGLTTIKIFENGGFLCFWWARVSYWNAFEVSVRSYDAAKTNYNRVTNITDVVEPTGTKKVTVTMQTFLRSDVSATNAVDLRAPRFYDSENITYYTDPASTSNLLGLTVVNTITGNITGNAGTATSATSATSATTATNGFTFKPGWAGNQNLIVATGNVNSSLPSGFYEAYQATNSPTPTTWCNLINVRHSNTGNDHGFQLAMSYYDNNLWFRSYQGGTGANNGTFQSWAKTLSDQNYTDYTVTKTGTGASGTWAINVTGNAATASLATTSDRLSSADNRTISSSEDSAFRLRFGFTSWANNNSYPYADYLHLRSYSDASGGNDNLVMFRKDAIGMRIYQADFGTSVAYSSFKDVAFTDQSFFIGTTSVAINRASAALTLNGVNISGTAASETFGTVTGRGSSTTTQISVGTTSSGSMYTGIKSGAGYSDTVSGATFKSITDHPTGGSFAFAAYYNGAPETGTNSFFVAADGTGYFKGSVGIGTTNPVSKLHTYSGAGTAQIFNQLQLTNMGTPNTGDIVGIGFAAGESTQYGVKGSIGFVRTETYGRGALTFYTNNTAGTETVSTSNERMRIAADGNVGIGTTSPGYKLDVNGTFNATGTSTLAAVSITGTINSSATEAVRVNNNSGYISFYNTAGNSRTGYIQGLTGGSLTLSSENGAFLQFLVGGTERLRIDISGNVGIGTLSPTNKFEVETGANDTTGIRVRNSVNGVWTEIRRRSIECQGGDFWINGQTGWLELRTGNNSRLYIGSNGDVGIGTTAPGYKLDVNGNIHATAFPTSSDIRFKKNITPLQNSLEKIKKLQGVKYEWNEFVNSRRDGYKLNIPIIGLIAQDVEQVVPEIVDHWKLSEDCQDARSIDYPRLIPLLIEAMKEQQIIIENQNQKIENLIARMSALEAK